MPKKKFDGSIIRERQTVSLATLGDQAALALSNLTMQEDFRILKTELTASIDSMDDQDVAAGILLGIANGELSVAEIAECLVAQGPLDRNDRLLKERANRWVKILSQAEFNNNSIPGNGRTQVDMIFKGDNGSPIITSKDRWTYSDPEGWQFFIFNNTGTSLITGATVRLLATHYGVWVT